MVTWRKTGKNWVKEKKFLSITTKYKINEIVGYHVDLYDMSKGAYLYQQRRRLKTFKTKHQARQFIGAYMRKH